MMKPIDDGRSLAARWRNLAERRLDHLIELYRSGRWRRYHSEAEFLALVREARAALATWEALALPEATAAPLVPSANGVGAEHEAGKARLAAIAEIIGDRLRMVEPDNGGAGGA